MTDKNNLREGIIPDKTPIVYGERVIGHVDGDHKFDTPIKAIIYPYLTDIEFLVEDYVCSFEIRVTALKLKDDKEDYYGEYDNY